MAPGVFYKWWKICATQLKPLRHNGFSFDGLITPKVVLYQLPYGEK